LGFVDPSVISSPRSSESLWRLPAHRLPASARISCRAYDKDNRDGSSAAMWTLGRAYCTLTFSLENARSMARNCEQRRVPSRTGGAFVFISASIRGDTGNGEPCSSPLQGGSALLINDPANQINNPTSVDRLCYRVAARRPIFFRCGL